MPVYASTSLRQRLIIYFYVGFLYLAWPFSGVWGTSARFLMKDHLHMTSGEIANFLFWVNFPAYLGFAFGFIRDRWGPFGRRDQGLLILFCGLATAFLFAASGINLAYPALFVVFLTSSVFGQFISSAQQGLTSVVGQEHLMSGRISSVWQAAAGVPALVVSVVAGHLAKDLAPHKVFLIGGAVGLAVTLFTLWRPKAVYGHAETAPIAPAHFLEDVRRLVKTPALYPIVLLLFLWNFTPGVGTPIQFYLTDTLHGDATDYGNFNAIFNGCFIPTFLLYGFLCTRVPYRPLLWICTLIAVPQILPMLIVHNAHSAMIAAIPMGLMGGPATAAYFDLLIRACPAGLQGTVMMLGSSAWVLSAELGNVAGSSLFDRFHSFAPCAWATFFVYACLLPILYFVPKHLTASRDGEASIGEPVIA
jgi:MFS family permease